MLPAKCADSTSVGFKVTLRCKMLKRWKFVILNWPIFSACHLGLSVGGTSFAWIQVLGWSCCQKLHSLGLQGTKRLSCSVKTSLLTSQGSLFEVLCSVRNLIKKSMLQATSYLLKSHFRKPRSKYQMWRYLGSAWSNSRNPPLSAVATSRLIKELMILSSWHWKGHNLRFEGNVM